MTAEEAKGKLYLQWQEFLEHNLDYAGISDAYKMAFKALDQMDVLDKIREEIKSTIDEEKAGQGNVNKGVVIGLQMTLMIIDKHINGEEQERRE